MSQSRAASGAACAASCVLVAVVALFGCAGAEREADDARLVSSSAPDGVDVDEAVGLLADDLRTALGAGQSAVLEPVAGDASGSVLADMLAERLASALGTRGVALLASDAERQAILGHLGEQLRDGYDAATTPEVGRWLGFRWSVGLRVVQRPASLALTAVAFDLETGRRHASSASLARAGLDDLLRPAVAPAASRDWTATVGWTVDDPRGRVPSADDFWSLSIADGTELRLTLQADADVHVLVATVGSSGRGLLLLPHDARPDGRLAAGERLGVPPEGLPPFAFEGEPGEEAFWIVLSARPLVEVAELADALAAPRLHLADGRLDIAERSFVPATEAARWAAALDALVHDATRARGAEVLAEHLERGDLLADVSYRDLGNARVAPARRASTAGRTTIERTALVRGTGVKAVKFVVRHGG